MAALSSHTSYNLLTRLVKELEAYVPKERSVLSRFNSKSFGRSTKNASLPEALPTLCRDVVEMVKHAFPDYSKYEAFHSWELVSVGEEKRLLFVLNKLHTLCINGVADARFQTSLVSRFTQCAPMTPILRRIPCQRRYINEFPAESVAQESQVRNGGWSREKKALSVLGFPQSSLGKSMGHRVQQIYGFV